tara:strand:- start:41 stop:430 length:390 start_codon:yes stop_codon:yes gene_type:complete
MKGHSIPGIKGFKSTSKENGRAASSAFQQTDNIIPTPTLDAEVFKYEAVKPAEEEDISAGTYGGQSGVNFALQEIIKAKKRLNTPEAKEAREANKKAREEKKAKRQTEKLEKKQYKDSEKVQVGLNIDE